MKAKEKRVKLDHPMIYLYIYRNLMNWHGKYHIVSRKAMLETIRRTVYQISRRHHGIIILEMLDMGLIDEVDSDTFKVNDCDAALKNFERQFTFW